ncbi:hypothetical protein RND81_03G006500, partial [Saponaria officinalis]
GERLREALHQQKNQQIALLFNEYHSKTLELLRKKEQELEKLKEKTKLLEEYLKKKQDEVQLWQIVAREKEEMIMELCKFVSEKDDDRNDDAESVCDCESLNNARRDQECKWCNREEMCVVFLPCRHVCCCKQCELLLEFCPVCQSVKQGCLEILLS